MIPSCPTTLAGLSFDNQLTKHRFFKQSRHIEDHESMHQNQRLSAWRTARRRTHSRRFLVRSNQYKDLASRTT
jgi:hypothetical protein